jgi:uncharacterized surface protein with fasciclin (FAS1) repeats
MSRLSLLSAAAIGALVLIVVVGAPPKAPTTGTKDDRIDETIVNVGASPMFSSKNMVENMSTSVAHTKLLAALKAGGLVATLEGAGPYTVFAPTNAAFARLPVEIVDRWLRPEGKARLAEMLIYHVVAGRTTTANLIEAIDNGGGTTTMRTVEGSELTFAHPSIGRITITDLIGNEATIVIPDVPQSNGIIHVTDTVLLPGWRGLHRPPPE